MIYLKSYCYSDHELPFIIANLTEGFDYIEKLVLYEYNYTHTGVKKEYNVEKVLHLIPSNLRDKLVYKKIDISNYIEYAYDDGPLIHNINEPIQRSWFFNDDEFTLNDSDIIIDVDIDEIMYKNSYPLLIKELDEKNQPFSIKLNQFFFKPNYLWQSCNFSSPTIYRHGMVKNNHRIKGLKIYNRRDLQLKSSQIYGCHMSWIMPIKYMIKKLHSYSHPEYRKYADEKVLQQAIDNKEYVFNKNKKFDILELKTDDTKIPVYLQTNINLLFKYLE
jgi:hypothetical protein